MRTSKIVSITLPPTMLKQADKLARKENRTKSELVREALRRYIVQQEYQELQRQGRERARRLGLKQSDVNRLIHEYRAEQATGKATKPS
jgi:CopG family transcriptional regulator/antitoxin EndoAI